MLKTKLHYSPLNMHSDFVSHIAHQGDLVDAIVITPLAGCAWLPDPTLPEPLYIPNLVLRSLWGHRPVIHLASFTLESPLEVCKLLAAWKAQWNL